MATLKIDLLVDKEKNRVVFAESGSDFVDTLFSFLTLPMGTIVRLLGKQSSVGCFDKLYQSVENLCTESFETKDCKTLLLQPKNASEAACENLKINIDDLKTQIYTCSPCHYASLVYGLKCPSAYCSQLMTINVTSPKAVCMNGVFLEDTARFIITDNFNIIPLSTASVFAVLQQFHIKNATSLERKTVDVGRNEILRLLKTTLLSRSPLSDVFLREQESNISIPADHKFIGMNLVKIKTEISSADSTDCKKIHMKIFYSILSNKFLHAEIGDDVADLLLSFLTFPLGSIVKILNKDSSLGCLDNLYKSVERLVIPVHIKSEKEREMLVAPKLYLHHSCRNALVKIDEESTAYKNSNLIDPKLPASAVKKGGFAKRLVKFAVSEGLVLTPLSLFSTIDIYKGLNEPISSLAEMEVSIGEEEALNLLKACLLSPTPMKDLFLAKEGRKALNLLKACLISPTPLKDLFLAKQGHKG